jgi:sulfate permease
MNIGAIMGLGMSKVGGKEIFSKASVRRLFITWIISPVIAFLLAFLLCGAAEKLF